MRRCGTCAKYVVDKCRCDACTVASREDQKARRRLHAGIWKLHYARMAGLFVVRNAETGEIAFRGPKAEAVQRRDKLNESVRDPLWATPELMAETLSHIAALRSAGVGVRRIAEVSGVGRSRVADIATGRMRKRRVKWSTAQRILAVTVDAAAPKALVSADETWRLIEEMLDAGATRTRIAKALGYTHPGLQFNGERITKKNADAIRRLHDAFFRGSADMRAICRCPWNQVAA